MDIAIHISFDVNAIFVQAGPLNKKFANLMAIQKGFNKIISIGETEEEIAAHDPLHWERIKGTVTFKPIFDMHSFDPERMYWATRMLASNIHHELRGVNLFDRILCDLNIPQYEMAPLASTQRFEMRLERWPKLSSLSVNGAVSILKSWKYYFARFALNWSWRVLLGIFLIVFVIRRDVLFAILMPLINTLSVFGVLCLMAFIALGMLWTAEMFWLVIMQWLLPRQTLHRIFSVYQLQFVPEHKASVSKVLADWILGKNE